MCACIRGNQGSCSIDLHISFTVREHISSRWTHVVFYYACSSANNEHKCNPLLAFHCTVAPHSIGSRSYEYFSNGVCYFDLYCKRQWIYGREVKSRSVHHDSTLTKSRTTASYILVNILRILSWIRSKTAWENYG